MDIEHDLAGTTARVAVGKNNQVMILMERVDQSPVGPKRSGKHIRLGMTAADAMRLLALLSAVQKKLALPIPADVTVEAVPPAKDRH